MRCVVTATMKTPPKQEGGMAAGQESEAPRRSLSISWRLFPYECYITVRNGPKRKKMPLVYRPCVPMQLIEFLVSDSHLCAGFPLSFSFFPRLAKRGVCVSISPRWIGENGCPWKINPIVWGVTLSLETTTQERKLPPCYSSPGGSQAGEMAPWLPSHLTSSPLASFPCERRRQGEGEGDGGRRRNRHSCDASGLLALPRPCVGSRQRAGIINRSKLGLNPALGRPDDTRGTGSSLASSREDGK